ncbi:MAG: hypothetical protein IPO07_11330 [Haliscomenobacter sp.]|nr:hypothetical protein [Haliscomenobacter sp.]
MEGGMGVAVARAVLSVPRAWLFAVLMGYYFSLAKFHEGTEKNKLLLKACGCPSCFMDCMILPCFIWKRKDLVPGF